MNSIGFPNTDIYSEHEHGGEESFWPAFTDIMMVIVMTFLLITVAVILNNYQLITNLKASIAAERQAATQAQTALQAVETKSKENETLEERLARLENLLSVRTKNLQQSRQQQQEILQALDSSKQQYQQTLQTLTNSNQQREETLQALEDSKERQQAAQIAIQKLELARQQDAEALTSTQQLLEEQKQQAELLQKENNKTINETIKTAKQAEEKLINVQEKLNNADNELSELKQKDVEGNERLVSLQGELDQLDKKYQKLLRPARSTKNKYVVRVVFNKNSGGYSYQLAEQEHSALKTLNRNELDAELTQLKKEHGDSLYVKIIIPESSDVSHSEAWKFTSEILNEYDYYHSENSN